MPVHRPGFDPSNSYQDGIQPSPPEVDTIMSSTKVAAAPGTPDILGEDIHDMAEPAFDHHTYPELIDAILEHAPIKSLLAFRATDRHYRGRIDDLLCEHVIALPSEPETAKRGFELRSFKFPNCLLPSIPYDSSDPFDKWAAGGGKGDPPQVSPAAQAGMDCREDVAARIRVVDMYGKPRLPYPFRQAFQDLDVIRYAGEWDPPVGIAYAPTIVDFIDLPRRSANLGQPTYFDPGEGVTRHIVHFGYPAKLDGQWVADVAMFAYPTIPEDVRDVVLVFSARNREANTTTAQQAESSSAAKPQTHLLSILAKFAKYAVARGGTMTYVGVDDIPAGNFTPERISGPQAVDKLRANVTQDLADAVKELKLEATQDALASRVSYMTIDEWRASLAEEDVEVEAEWPTFEAGL
jgi:hypothetical protein